MPANASIAFVRKGGAAETGSRTALRVTARYCHLLTPYGVDSASGIRDFTDKPDIKTARELVPEPSCRQEGTRPAERYIYIGWELELIGKSPRSRRGFPASKATQSWYDG